MPISVANANADSPSSMVFGRAWKISPRTSRR